MPLSWNEIRSRSLQFSKDWADESSEHAEAKSFWDEFFNIFGISRRRIASFEQHVKKIDGKEGYIDLLWKGVLLIEHKSRGKNLDRAHTQALDYFPGLKERDLPRYIMVSDFARFRLYDLDESTEHEFILEDLHKNINHFGFIAGYQTHTIKEQDPVNIDAAERMGKLHDQMKEVGYDGHPLELYLVRLLFCMFAEDTGIFERQQFQDYIEERTTEDGADLASHLATLFQVLNMPSEKRLKNRDEQLAAFPYVNGKLFEEILPTAGFDTEMRQVLLDCCTLDWSRISPAIFGSLFQSIMDKKARRNLGAHYTSEKNILKLINPLFMDDLHAEFEDIKLLKQRKAYQKGLTALHEKMRNLTFLDPACGCGNFLVIAYRELRLLELEMWRHYQNTQQELFDVNEMIQLDVDQFYGIEIEEFPAQIAQVALWLMDHQMNLLVSEEFGQYYARIPLGSSANIVHDNALQLDWNDVISAENLSYIMSNPPFIGSKFQNEIQRKELAAIVKNIQNGKLLDYVSAWYLLAAQFIEDTSIKVAFVSTNSIAQGEQVGILWREMLDRYNMNINFAHTTFRWSNEASGKAVVYCVIISFSGEECTNKRLFVYDNINDDPFHLDVSNINPYLVEGQNIFIQRLVDPISNVPPFIIGSKPLDGGYLCLNEDEKDELIIVEKDAEKFIRPLIGAKEFLYNQKRFCIWLENASPSELKKLKHIRARVQKVKEDRLNGGQSKQSCADKPHLFGDNRQPKSNFLVIPKLSSENRKYIPMGFYSPEYIVTDLVSVIPSATKYHFGVLTSIMHMSWVKYVSGKFKSDYRYTNLVYNNYPWPLNPTNKQQQDIEEKAQAVLDTREQFSDSTLADLYDPLTMPPALLKAHQILDKAVDAAYGKRSLKTEAERVAFLFDLYEQYTSLLPKEETKGRKRKNG